MGPARRDFVVVLCFDDAARRRFVMVRHRRRGWELPGGGIEPGEAPAAAAAREFQEETGHVLLASRLLLEEERPHGRGWTFEGVLGPPVAPLRRAAAEDVVEVRLVAGLDDVSPLAFPDDPYDAIGRAAGRLLRTRPGPGS